MLHMINFKCVKCNFKYKNISKIFQLFKWIFRIVSLKVNQNQLIDGNSQVEVHSSLMTSFCTEFSMDQNMLCTYTFCCYCLHRLKIKSILSSCNKIYFIWPQMFRLKRHEWISHHHLKVDLFVAQQNTMMTHCFLYWIWMHLTWRMARHFL